MLKTKMTTALQFVQTKLSGLKKIFREHSFNFSQVGFDVISISVLAIVFLYYPIGGWLTDNIDRSPAPELKKSTTEQSQTVNMMAHMINREVNDKIWTPNLPFFFPSYFLDNMPNFQLGMFDALSKFTNAFEKCANSNVADKENTSSLYKAAVLLRYPGTIWLFSPQNKIKPVPSAGSQYRKARRLLIKYNDSLAAGQNVLEKNVQYLIYILKKSNQNLSRSSNRLTGYIREESSSFFDTKADDVFYYNQGKAYGYYLLFQALGQDYKDIIVASNQYQNWISLTKALEESAAIRPAIVRNGSLNSIFTPNHLSYLNSYILKAQNLLGEISKNLKNLSQEQPKE